MHIQHQVDALATPRLLFDCPLERLTTEMFNVVSDPNELSNVMLKKLQPYNETEAVLKESGNKLILEFMKMAVENRMMITQIKNDLDLQARDLTRRVEQLEEEIRSISCVKSIFFIHYVLLPGIKYVRTRM